jgi:hypothetical protein
MMTHDEPEIEQAWARLNELSEDLYAFALQWVALDRVGVVATGDGAGDVVAEVERQGRRVDEVLFHHVNLVVER